MSVYLGPCSYGAPYQETLTIPQVGNLDMKFAKIINLKHPEYAQDAATMQYVSNYATYLNNNKVDYAGGRMTGVLDMGDNKIINVSDPKNDKDAVNKKYVENFLSLNFYVIGRYLVILNGVKIYASIRTKKNIDLTNPILNITSEEEISSQDMRIELIKTILPNGNKLGIIQLDRPLQIRTPGIPEPWTFLISAKNEQAQISTLIFGDNIQPVYLFMKWSSEALKYEITNSNIMNDKNATSIDIDTNFNHIGFKYVSNKLTLWVNGKSRKSYTVDLGDLTGMTINANQLGIISLYNRELSKMEMAEHFVEYQVKNFTDYEVFS